MNILPNWDKAVVPVQKLIHYTLDFTKDPNKAAAFKSALGYTKHNYQKLIDNIYSNISHYAAVYKGNKGFGDTYEVVMKLIGENKKAAKVLTGWIIEDGTDYPRLTSAYITKKKVEE